MADSKSKCFFCPFLPRFAHPFCFRAYHVGLSGAVHATTWWRAMYVPRRGVTLLLLRKARSLVLYGRAPAYQRLACVPPVMLLVELLNSSSISACLSLSQRVFSRKQWPTRLRCSSTGQHALLPLYCCCCWLCIVLAIHGAFLCPPTRPLFFFALPSPSTNVDPHGVSGSAGGGGAVPATPHQRCRSGNAGEQLSGGDGG